MDRAAEQPVQRVGSVNGCLVSVICARRAGSSRARAWRAASTPARSGVPSPTTPARDRSASARSGSACGRSSYPLKAGFGYRFGGGVDLLGNSCDFSAYEATRSEPARVRAGDVSDQIARGTQAVTLASTAPTAAEGDRPRSGRHDDHLAGDTRGAAAPGPVPAGGEQDGQDHQRAAVKPAAGAWTVKAAPARRRRPTRVDRSNFETPPTLFGQVRWSAAGHREVAFAYAVPAGAKVDLVERRKRIARTIVRSVRGQPCRRARPCPVAAGSCVRGDFRPSRGPGGQRRSRPS